MEQNDGGDPGPSNSASVQPVKQRVDNSEADRDNDMAMAEWNEELERRQRHMDDEQRKFDENASTLPHLILPETSTAMSWLVLWQVRLSYSLDGSAVWKTIQHSNLLPSSTKPIPSSSTFWISFLIE